MAEDTHKEISMDNHNRLVAVEKRVEALPEMERKLNDLHRLLLEKSPTGEPPLSDRVTRAVVAFERASWMGKFGVWLLLGLGSMAAAGSGIIGFLQRFGK